MIRGMLAAVVFDRERNDDVDAVLRVITDELTALGVPLAGAKQHTRARAGGCACDLVLHDLASARDVLISEDRGPSAEGCRLDPAALDEAVALSLAALDDGARVLIVNRFGKLEAAGGGFRIAIATAMSQDVPTLVAVGTERLAAWRAFAAGCASELACDPRAVRAWLTDRDLSGGGTDGQARGVPADAAD